MKKTYKGQFGYLPAQFRRELLKTILLFGSSIAILIIGMVTQMQRNPGMSLADSKNNILTVAAVLGLLPASRSLISTIMFVKGKKYTCPATLRDQILVIADEKKLPIFSYDLYLTSYDQIFPVYVMAATDNELLGFLAGKADVTKAQEHIKEALQKDGQKNVTVKLYKDADKFLQRIEGASAAKDAADEQELKKAAAHLEVVMQIAL